MKHINLNLLKYFYYVADLGSVSRASESLNVTQPTVSHQLKVLEEQLGTQLLKKSGRKLVTTAKGREIYDHCQKIIGMTQEIVRTAGDETIADDTPLRVGYSLTLPFGLLERIDSRLLKEKGVFPEILSMPGEFVGKSLLKGDITFAITDSPITGSAFLKEVVIATDDVYCVAGKKKVGLKQNFPQSIDGEQYLRLPKGTQLQQEIDTYLLAHNRRCRAVGETDSADLIINSVEKGKVLGFLPETKIKQAVKGRRIAKLGKLPNIKANYWLVTTRSGFKNPIIKKLINYLK